MLTEKHFFIQLLHYILVLLSNNLMMDVPLTE